MTLSNLYLPPCDCFVYHACRFRAWDAIGIVTATMDELHQARRSVVSSAG